MIKILTVLGARPQFIKAAALSRVFRANGSVNEVIVHTGQHFDANMSDVFFQELNIPEPAYNLNINSLSHGAMTGQMLEGIERICQTEKPDYVLVFGDTNSTIAGALAAKKLHLKVIHVEAGLRSFNMSMPEEINRILTDRISDVLCCPTETAIRNLKKEGFEHFAVTMVNTGDVMQDAALFYANRSETEQILELLKLNGPFVLCTLHRAENTDDPGRLKSIMRALSKINKTVRVVMPVHPRTKSRLGSTADPNIMFIEPQGYLNMIALLKSSSLVMTDSGGLQKEAYFFDKYCLTLRTETEWVELVEHGYNEVVGYSEEKIYDAFQRAIGKKWNNSIDLYGGGKASEKIYQVILEHAQKTK
jgi:UDP-GlcNAc3NAcA epimerase